MFALWQKAAAKTKTALQARNRGCRTVQKVYFAVSLRQPVRSNVQQPSSSRESRMSHPMRQGSVNRRRSFCQMALVNTSIWCTKNSHRLCRPKKLSAGPQSVIGVQFTAQMAEDPDAAYTDGSAQNVIGVCAGSKFNINALLAAPCPGDQHGKEKRDPVTIQQCLMLAEQLPQCEVHDNDHCNIQTLGKILYLPCMPRTA